jgi:hypothetical protein
VPSTHDGAALTGQETVTVKESAVAWPLVLDEKSASQLNIAAVLFVAAASSARQASAIQGDARRAPTPAAPRPA